MTSPRKHGLLVFLVASFGFSWGLWTLMILSQRGLLPFTVPTHWSGSFGPAVGGIVAVAWTEGGAGLRSLFRRFLLWRAGAGVWLLALLGIVAAYVLALAVFALLPGRTPAVAAYTQWLTLLAYAGIILVIGGPLGEEIGWRGFLQPYLQVRMAPFWASCAVGVVWVTWHVPLVWLEGAAQKGESILAFALLVLPLTFVFTWAFNAANGSLLLPLVLHTSINTVSYVVVPQVLGPLAEDAVLTRCFTGVLWAAALLLVWRSRRRFFAAPASADPGTRLSGASR
jgi:membrane protease YdiL (CAAX protease family)